VDDHFRAEHLTRDQSTPQGDNAAVEEGLVVFGVIAKEDLGQETDDGTDDLSDRAFACLRLAGLL